MVAGADIFGKLEVKAAVRSARLAQEGHFRFGRSAVAFFDIAAHAGSDDVVPGIAAAARPRHDVIEREFVAAAVAILAAVLVAIEHVATSKRNFFVRDGNVVAQADDGGKWKPRIDEPTVVFYLFGFSLEQKDNGSLPRRNIKRLVGSIKDENFAHRAARFEYPPRMN